jgi:hypothetical protein
MIGQIISSESMQEYGLIGAFDHKNQLSKSYVTIGIELDV